MTTANLPELRIFCLCGQKMKVLPSMYGRRGKCIACRQKIRIPRVEELPDDSGELHLKEHPQFLRKTARPDAPAPEEAPPADAREELALDAEPDTGDSLPLDTVETLSLLCSFDHEIARQLKSRDNGAGSPRSAMVGEATLKGYQALVENVRNDYDEQMKVHLGKVSEMLSEVEERIIHANLDARMGETPYSKFEKLVVPLRQRREFLVRRKQNLLGWLDLKDPYLAGGLRKVKLEDVPCDRIEMTLPPDPMADAPLLDRCVALLRSALHDREEAERKITAWKRMRQEDALSADAGEAPREEYEAERKRALAAIAFYQQRLNQLIRDCDNDIKAIKANLEIIRARYKAEEMEKSAYQQQEMSLIEAQSDNAKARDLARAALNAKTAAELPELRGTFLKRIGTPRKKSAIGVDCWLAWLAAVCMLSAIVVPISPHQINANMVEMRGLVTGLFIVAVAIAMAAAISVIRVRGAIYQVLWVAYAIGASAYLHEMRQTLTTAGGAMRGEPWWFLTPGVLLLIAGGGVAAMAAAVALADQPRGKHTSLWGAGIVLASMIIIFTNYAGLYRAKPVLTAAETGKLLRPAGLYPVTFTLSNEGRRSFWLGSSMVRYPRPVTLRVERQNAAGAWEIAGGPVSVKEGGGQAFHALGGEPPEIAPGGEIALRYELPPASYRYSLEAGGKTLDRAEVLALAPIVRDPEIESLLNGLSGADPVDPAQASQGEVIRVRLRGVMDPPGQSPVASFELRPEEGDPIDLRLRIGENIRGPWNFVEYNPGRSSLTLSDGEQFLIVHTGETVTLSLPPAEPKEDAKTGRQ